MSDLSTTPQKQSASYFNLANNGMSASEILGTSAASSAQSTANEFKSFLKEAVDTVNAGVIQAKNTASGVQNLTQQVSNKTGANNLNPDIASLYSENDLFKELYGTIPSAQPEQKIVALADQKPKENSATEDVAEAEETTTEKVVNADDVNSADTENNETETAAVNTDTEEVADATTTAAETQDTPENSEEDSETTDKVAAADNKDDEKDEDTGDIMDVLSNVATLGTIATLLV